MSKFTRLTDKPLPVVTPRPTRVRILEIEITDGFHKNWLGDTVQVHFSDTDLEVGDSVQVARMNCRTTTNVLQWDDYKTGQKNYLGVGHDNWCDFTSMLGKVSKVLFGYEGMSNDNKVRKNIQKAKGFTKADIADTFVKVYKMNNTLA